MLYLVCLFEVLGYTVSSIIKEVLPVTSRLFIFRRHLEIV